MHMMRVRMAVAGAGFGLLLTGCTSDGSGSDGDGDVTAATITASPNLVADDGRFLAIKEVGFGESGYVSLHNFTDAPASLSGLHLCEPPKCVALPDSEIAPGESAVVAKDDGGESEATVLSNAALDLNPASGEIGLYASEAADSAEDLRDYLEWGSTPHEGTATAIEAGLWIEGSYLNSSPEAVRIFQTPEKWEWE